MKARLADPALRSAVEAAVRRRVRGDDAEDVVQATLADVLSAAEVPEDAEEFRRFVFGVARNKVFDHFRRQRRESEGLDDHDPAGPEAPLSARDILRWAEDELPDSESKNTLEWMLREGDGEKLEHIARDAQVPAPRVRKRVSRLRKFLRDRWAAELMLAGLVVLLGAFGAIYWLAKQSDAGDVVKPEPLPVPSSPRTLPPSRPAGDAESGPNLAPLPSAAPVPSVVPAPSASAVPAPSAVPSVPPKGKQAPPAKPRPQATDKTTSVVPMQEQKFESKAKATAKAKADSSFPTHFDGPNLEPDLEAPKK
jgi:RNA polymerase sigma factor (sigma-70 family)